MKNPSPCDEQLFLSGLRLDSRVIQQVVSAFCCVEIYLVVIVVVLTITCIIKSVVTRQAPVTLELRNTPGKTQTNSRC